MPTYQYACTSCGERLEVVQKFSDDPLTVCPTCHGKLRKLFSPVGVVFKGSGFYKTDSRSSSSTPSAGSSSAGSSSSGDGSGDSGGSSGSGDSGSGKTGGDKPTSSGDKVA
ncbi:MAG TPA: FmdB family zinc ribbon protein [Mycobacteriales bacterium]|nr:FmdB family zinc ribbon protein [Mycobacteriales bacterium]